MTGETIASDPGNNSGSNGRTTHQIDRVGNRIAATSTFTEFNPAAATYDNNGNTQTIGANTFPCDSLKHLVSMTNGGVSVGIVYDAFGNRVSKTVNGVTTRYLVDDGLKPTGLPQTVGAPGSTTVQRNYDYDAFGNMVKKTGTTPNSDSKNHLTAVTHGARFCLVRASRGVGSGKSLDATLLIMRLRRLDLVQPFPV
jgi:YD repeat-containing protein